MAFPPPDPIFPPGVPLEPPESGCELRPAGALQRDHQRMQQRVGAVHRVKHLAEPTSPIVPPVRMIRYPMSSMLFTGKFGDVRAAMDQMLHAEFEEEHHPFIDPSRPEGQTHIVDEEALRREEEVEVDNSKVEIEWKTNIYG